MGFRPALMDNSNPGRSSHITLYLWQPQDSHQLEAAATPLCDSCLQ